MKISVVVTHPGYGSVFRHTECSWVDNPICTALSSLGMRGLVYSSLDAAEKATHESTSVREWVTPSEVCHSMRSALVIDALKPLDNFESIEIGDDPSAIVVKARVHKFSPEWVGSLLTRCIDANGGAWRALFANNETLHYAYFIGLYKVIVLAEKVA